MIRICAILGRDRAYSSKLAEYFNTQDRLGFKTIACSSLEEYISATKEYKVAVLLTDEESFGLLGAESSGICKAILTEDGYSTYKDVPAIYKYKPADEILRELLCIYSDGSSQELLPAAGAKADITAIYSPINRIGKTSFSIAYAKCLAARQRTLLITLEEFKSVFALISQQGSGDFSDVIYYYLQGDYSWSRLKSTVHSMGELDYIPPVRYAEDLLQLSDEDVHALFSRIAGESGYEHIVIDFGSFGKRAAVLLEVCESIYMPVLEDSISQGKLQEFYNYLDISGREHIKNKIISIELPRERGRDYKGCELSNYINSALYDKAEELIDKKESSFEAQ